MILPFFSRADSSTTLWCCSSSSSRTNCFCRNRLPPARVLFLAACLWSWRPQAPKTNLPSSLYLPACPIPEFLFPLLASPFIESTFLFWWNCSKSSPLPFLAPSPSSWASVVGWFTRFAVVDQEERVRDESCSACTASSSPRKLQKLVTKYSKAPFIIRLRLIERRRRDTNLLYSKIPRFPSHFQRFLRVNGDVMSPAPDRGQQTPPPFPRSLYFLILDLETWTSPHAASTLASSHGTACNVRRRGGCSWGGGESERREHLWRGRWRVARGRPRPRSRGRGRCGRWRSRRRGPSPPCSLSSSRARSSSSAPSTGSAMWVPNPEADTYIKRCSLCSSWLPAYYYYLYLVLSCVCLCALLEFGEMI